MTDFVVEFWKKWYEASEARQQAIMEELLDPLLEGFGISKPHRYSIAALVNSYLKDAVGVLKERGGE